MTENSTDRFPRLAAVFAKNADSFPHTMVALHERLVRKIEALWGTPEAIRYMDSLVLSDRQTRHGFSDRAMEELGNLKQAHESIFPQLSINPHDPFSTATASVPPACLTTPRAEQGDLGAEARNPGQAEMPPVPEEVIAAAHEALELRRHGATWSELHEVDELRLVLEARRRGEMAPAKDSHRLGEILLDHGLVSAETVEAALHVQTMQSSPHEPIGKVLNKMGAVSTEDITRALCQQTGVLMVDLHGIYIEAAAMRKVPIEIARTHRTVPVAVVGDHLFLAVDDPFNFSDREYFSFLTNLKVELVFAAGNRLTQRLADYGQSRSSAEADREFRSLAKKAFVDLPNGGDSRNQETVASEEDASVIGLVNKMINDAAAANVSDIHLEAFPSDQHTHIRFRRDGRLEEYSQFPSAFHEAVISRIKIMSNLDIAERRKPQDGKIYFVRPGNGRLDLRVATIPTIRGIEDVTIRLLPAGEPMAIDAIGMDKRDLAVFRRLIEKPYGLLVVCGPTGSGKTTTLHSALRELNTPERKIWTAEDPVEIVQKNICQVQVNPRIGWTFPIALRAFLRADPDIIMIGEMRDQETARIALEASMTGHLVLSTLHTNSSSETAARLLDLGVDPYNLSDAVLGILAQRLARKLCPECAERGPLTKTELEDLATEYYYAARLRQPSFAERDVIITEWREQFGKDGELALWRPKGCEHCQGAGYKGRLGLYEVLEGTPAIRKLIRSQASASDFLNAAIAEGMTNLKQGGIRKALRGLTDMLQVRSACF